MTCTVTNTITRPSGAPWDNDTVAVSIAGPGFLSGSQQLIGQSQDLTDSTGAVSFALPPNNTGELYVWTNPDGKHYPFQVTATSGTIPLGQLLVTQNVPAGVIAATQAAMVAYVAAQLGTKADASALTTETTRATAAEGANATAIAAKADPSTVDTDGMLVIS